MPGSLAIAAQSGAVGIAVLDQASRIGLGISEFVSLGNKVDVSGNDLLLHWWGDPRTAVIGLYLESFGNPRKFGRLARLVGRTKPILVVKGGRSAGGRRAGASHTAAAATPGHRCRRAVRAVRRTADGHRRGTRRDGPSACRTQAACHVVVGWPSSATPVGGCARGGRGRRGSDSSCRSSSDATQQELTAAPVRWVRAIRSTSARPRRRRAWPGRCTSSSTAARPTPCWSATPRPGPARVEDICAAIARPRRPIRSADRRQLSRCAGRRAGGFALADGRRPAGVPVPGECRSRVRATRSGTPSGGRGRRASYRSLDRVDAAGARSGRTPVPADIGRTAAGWLRRRPSSFCSVLGSLVHLDPGDDRDADALTAAEPVGYPVVAEDGRSAASCTRPTSAVCRSVWTGERAVATAYDEVAAAPGIRRSWYRRWRRAGPSW